MHTTQTGQDPNQHPVDADLVGTYGALPALTAPTDLGQDPREDYPAGHPGQLERPAGGDLAPRGQLTLVHFVYDNSLSVQPQRHVFIQEHNAGRAYLRQQGEGSMVRATVCTFDSEARVVLPLCELGDPRVGELALPADGRSTDLTAPAELVLKQMREDGRALQAQGYQVMRGLVIVITDGFDNHGRDYRAAWKALREAPFGPIVLGLGLQGADPGAIRDIASEDLAFMADDGHDIESQIREAIRFAFKTVVTFSKTVQNAASTPGQTGSAPTPPTPAGFLKVGAPATY